MYYLLGADIGTSGTKTALYDTAGNLISSATFSYPLYQERNGWAEQEPADWWNAVCLGIRKVISDSGVDPAAIKGVGLSGQMHGLVMLDKEGKVLRKSIIWCDQRTGEEVRWMDNNVGRDKMISITANPSMTGFTAAKILWVKNNEPEIYEKCAHILLPKDYIRYMLTGEFATEVSDASGMQLMDVAHRCWSDEILGAFDIKKSLLGKMYESQDVTGCITAKAAELTGLAKGTIVVGGAGDNPAAAIGTGIYSEGSAFTTIGTSGVVYAVSDEVRIDKDGRVHTLCASVPGKWTVMSCTQGAGLSLQWLRNQVCTSECAQAEAEHCDPYDIMADLAKDIPIGANGLIYLPYLMGERSPHPDPDCRGVFFGLSAIHTRAHLIRAVMEGVAYSQGECVDVFAQMGVKIDKMLLCGGGARSALWRQMLADIYGCKVHTLASEQGGALGVAILAGVGAGIYPDIESACKQMISIDKEYLPDSERAAQYRKFMKLYSSLYSVLKDSWKTLASITE